MYFENTIRIHAAYPVAADNRQQHKHLSCTNVTRANHSCRVNKGTGESSAAILEQRIHLIYTQSPSAVRRFDNRKTGTRHTSDGVVPYGAAIVA